MGEAEQIVGTLSDGDRRLYARGLRYITVVHLKAGTFTIGQVIDDERHREDLASKQREAAARAATTAGETSDVKAMLALTEHDSLAQAIRGLSIDGNSLTLTVDESYWRSLSGRSQDLEKQTIWSAWQVAYLKRSHDHNARVIVRLQNPAGLPIGTTFY